MENMLSRRNISAMSSNNPKKRLLVAFFVISILSIVYIAYIANTNTPPRQPSYTINTNLQISVVNVFPSSDTIGLGDSNIAILVTFNQPVYLHQINTTIKPNIQISTILKNDQKTLVIKPSSNWKSGTEYLITITGPSNKPLLEKKIKFVHPSEFKDALYEPPGGI